MPVKPELVTQSKQEDVAVTIAERSVAEVTSQRRGGGLHLYGLDAHATTSSDDERGATTIGEASSERAALFNYIRESTNLPLEQQQRLSMIVPDLVGAIGLDSSHTTRMYKKDIPSLGKIAVDWALDPESIDQTHIRIGFGGDERVTALGPAYLTAAFSMVERVKEVFDLQRNRALLKELIDRAPEKDAVIQEEPHGEKKDHYLRTWFNSAVGKELEPGKKPKYETKADQALSVNLRDDVTQADVTDLLVSKWEEILGSPPDMEELGKKFFFPVTDKLPQIIVFNASHTAINLNDMDRTKVMTAREITQDLLSSYAQAVHPEIAHVLHFQNDTAWGNWAGYDRQIPSQDVDEETTDWWLSQTEDSSRPFAQEAAYTKMYMEYSANVLGRKNGTVSAASDRLVHFADNHKKNGNGKINGHERHKFYGYAHHPFFNDIYEAAPTNTLPRTNIMMPYEEPRNTIYLQGRPEITFGVYRKLIREHAELNEFVSWLEARKEATQLANVAKEVTILAQDAYDLDQGYEQAIHKGIEAWIKQESEKHGLPSKLRKTDRDNFDAKKLAVADKIQSDARKLRGTLAQASFKEASDKQAAWHMIIADMETVYLPEVTDALEYATAHQTALSNLLRTAYERELTPEELTSEAAYTLFHKRAQAEFTTVVGDTPVYYPMEHVDAVVWPNGELPELTRYDEHSKAIKEKEKAQKGTTGLAIQYAEEVTIQIALKQNLPARSEIVSTDTETDHYHNTLLSSAVVRLQEAYEENYQLETSKASGEEVKHALRTTIAAAARALILDVATGKEISLEEATAYVYEHNLLQKLAEQTKEVVGSANNIARKQAEGRRTDYLAILNDINPDDHVAAEATYHQILRSLPDRQRTRETEAGNLWKYTLAA